MPGQTTVRGSQLAVWLAALLRRFHGGQVPGETYRPSPIYHSLGACGPRRDADGNPIPDTDPYSRHQVRYGGEQSDTNSLTGRPVGTWMSRSK
jgi:hypothetical protein